MSNQAKMPQTTAPVQTKVVVPGTPDRAYELFSSAFSEWWPLATHSAFGKEATSCVFEAKKGGRIFETGPAGREVLWGTVIEANEPNELRFTWHPGRGPDTAQEVLVRFSTMMFGTTVELEHHNWEVLGDKAKEIRGSYERDWPKVLELFAKRVTGG